MIHRLPYSMMSFVPFIANQAMEKQPVAEPLNAFTACESVAEISCVWTSYS